MAKIACIGHTTIDILYLIERGHLHEVDHTDDPEDQELCVPFPGKITVDKRNISMGGNAPNVGVGLIKTGHQVKLISRVGIDKIGQLTYQELEQEGFDLTYVNQQGESDSSLILSHKGDRTILAYHAADRYNFPEDLADVEWVYLTSLGFSDFSPFHQDLLAWLKNEPEVNLVYNPGRPEIKQGYESIAKLLQSVHTLNVNKQEAEKILDLEPSSGDTQGQVKELLVEFADRGVVRGIITNSRDGAYYVDRRGCFHIQALPFDPVDTTGAGDAFSSGYLAGIADGRDELDSLRLGVAQSGSVVQVPGATHGLQGLPELDQLLENYSNVVATEI